MDIENTPRLKRVSFDTRQRVRLSPYIECHRGCSLEAPENSLSSFSKAIEEGYNSVELDVWLTKDKVPMIIHGGHNGEIDETTD